MQIDLTAINKRYRDKIALCDITLQLQPGITALIGPNGAGKSTLLQLLATLQTPTSGIIYVGDTDVVQQPEFIQRRLGYVPQTFGFFGRLRGRDVLAYAAAMKQVPGTRQAEQIAQVITALDLHSSADERIGTLSAGMRQRLGIAQALIGDPALLVLDEPANALDTETRQRFYALLREKAQTCTVVLATHRLDDLPALANRVVLLAQGRISVQGTLNALAAHQPTSATQASYLAALTQNTFTERI